MQPLLQKRMKEKSRTDQEKGTKTFAIPTRLPQTARTLKYHSLAAMSSLPLIPLAWLWEANPANFNSSRTVWQIVFIYLNRNILCFLILSNAAIKAFGNYPSLVLYGSQLADCDNLPKML